VKKPVAVFVVSTSKPFFAPSERISESATTRVPWSYPCVLVKTSILGFCCAEAKVKNNATQKAQLIQYLKKIRKLRVNDAAEMIMTTPLAAD
jgi:hypothetical protein